VYGRVWRRVLDMFVSIIERNESPLQSFGPDLFSSTADDADNPIKDHKREEGTHNQSEREACSRLEVMKESDAADCDTV